jgi:hypothetical protein
MVSAVRFALIDDGMERPEVKSILGSPVSIAANPVEGMRREPLATCWHYLADDRQRMFSVCFVEGAVVTRGSYLLEGSGSP